MPWRKFVFSLQTNETISRLTSLLTLSFVSLYSIYMDNNIFNYIAMKKRDVRGNDITKRLSDLDLKNNINALLRYNLR